MHIKSTENYQVSSHVFVMTGNRKFMDDNEIYGQICQLSFRTKFAKKKMYHVIWRNSKVRQDIYPKSKKRVIIHKEENLVRKGVCRIVLMYDPLSLLSRITTFVEDQSPLVTNDGFGGSSLDMTLLSSYFPITSPGCPVFAIAVGILVIAWTEEEPF